MNGLELQIQRCEEEIYRRMEADTVCMVFGKRPEPTKMAWIAYLEGRLKMLEANRTAK